MTNSTVTLERQRVSLLLERDGHAQARKWVQLTRRIYAEALATPHSHASQPQYREAFETSIYVFDRWLDGALEKA
jgi:hypothetical protein